MTAAPPEIAHFVELIGEAATLMLLEQHGGTRITFPAGADTNIGRLLGAAAAASLFDHFGHERVAIPLAKRWRARVYRTRGMSYAQIARKLGCNEATVWKHLNQPLQSEQFEMALTPPTQPAGSTGRGLPAKG